MRRNQTTTIHPGEVAGGYRLLRKLGEGTRSEVFLGVAADEPHAAVKIYRPEVTRDDIARELEALARASHAHAVRARDTATVGSNGQCLIMERLELGSLAQLLEHRDELSCGEAITILAPLGAALDALHASGVTHGAISPRRVLFRATGAPVLTGFGHAGIHSQDLTAAALAEVSGVIDDRSAFGAVATTVLTRAAAAEPRVRPVIDWLEAQATDGYPDDLGDPLAQMLFAFADAEPVRFDRDERSAASLVPARAVASVSTPSPGAALPELASATRRTGLPSWVDDVVAESLDGSPLRALASRVREQARGVRRGIWLVAGGVGAALIVALLVVPESESSSAGPADPVPSETPYVVGDPLITGDDPLAAWASLAAQRERCIRDLSVLCLDGVDQAGSAALAEDVETVRALQAGAEMAVDDRVGDPQRAELIERLGDSALVRTMPESASGDEKTQPASVLLMKGEAGWRIRSWLPGG